MVTFHNVTITVDEKDSLEAYKQLCKALTHFASYRTDTFTRDEEEISTVELMRQQNMEAK